MRFNSIASRVKQSYLSQVTAWLFLFLHLFPYGLADRLDMLDCKIDDAAYCSNRYKKVNHGLHLLSEKASPAKSDGHCNSVSILRFGIVHGKKRPPALSGGGPYQIRELVR